MKKLAVILYGPPGSGKGAQADLLADNMGLFHIDTGKLLRAILSDRSRKNDPIIMREKKLNDAGILNTPSWFVPILQARIRSLFKMGYGIVLSGSPRTIYEAEKLMPFLEKNYGRKAIYVFVLMVPLVTAARRNRSRLICTTCQRPLLTAFYPIKNPRYCPICGGSLQRRIDDDPSKFKTRTTEYKTRTLPILKLLKKWKCHVRAIDARPAPYKVLKKIHDHLKKA
ncbi:MAG: nucleoside monophosphate kinase [Patescibacteria group bacterium]